MVASCSVSSERAAETKKRFEERFCFFSLTAAFYASILSSLSSSSISLLLLILAFFFVHLVSVLSLSFLLTFGLVIVPFAVYRSFSLSLSLSLFRLPPGRIQGVALRQTEDYALFYLYRELLNQQTPFFPRFSPDIGIVLAFASHSNLPFRFDVNNLTPRMSKFCRSSPRMATLYKLG